MSSKTPWLQISKHGRKKKNKKSRKLAVFADNPPVNHWHVSKIADDLWLDIVLMLDLKDFIYLRRTGHYFYNLTSNKDSSKINYFFKNQSIKLCRSIENTYKTRNWEEFHKQCFNFLIKNNYTTIYSLKHYNTLGVKISNYWLGLFESCVNTNITMFEMFTSNLDDNTWFSKTMYSIYNILNDQSSRFYKFTNRYGELNRDNSVLGELIRLLVKSDNVTMVKYILNRWPKAVNFIISDEKQDINDTSSISNNDDNNNGALHTLISLVTKHINNNMIQLVLNHPLFDDAALIAKDPTYGNLPFHNIFYYNRNTSIYNTGSGTEFERISMETLDYLMEKTNESYSKYISVTDNNVYKKNTSSGNGNANASIDSTKKSSLMYNSNGVVFEYGNNGKTPLMLAVSIPNGSQGKSFKTQIAEYILTHVKNININQQCRLHSKTALMYAAENGNLKGVKLLLDRNINQFLSPRVRFVTVDNKEQTVFHYAAKSGNLQVLSTVYKYVKSVCYNYYQSQDEQKNKNKNKNKYNNNNRYQNRNKKYKHNNNNNNNNQKGKGKKYGRNNNNKPKELTANMKARNWLLGFVNKPIGDNGDTPYIMACKTNSTSWKFYETLIDVCNVDITIKDNNESHGSSYYTSLGDIKSKLYNREYRRINK